VIRFFHVPGPAKGFFFGYDLLVLLVRFFSDPFPFLGTQSLDANLMGGRRYLSRGKESLGWQKILPAFQRNFLCQQKKNMRKWQRFHHIFDLEENGFPEKEG